MALMMHGRSTYMRPACATGAFTVVTVVVVANVPVARTMAASKLAVDRLTRRGLTRPPEVFSENMCPPSFPCSGAVPHADVDAAVRDKTSKALDAPCVFHEEAYGARGESRGTRQSLPPRGAAISSLAHRASAAQLFVRPRYRNHDPAAPPRSLESSERYEERGFMKVELTSPGFWTVTERNRHWSVRATGFGGHLIMDRRGQVVLTTSPTGRRILNAVNRLVR
jgi:hypothetical protein